jgi:F0F1-type ATP synthase assembly protein I
VAAAAGYPFGASATMLLVFALIGLGFAVLIPRKPANANANAKGEGEAKGEAGTGGGGSDPAHAS